MICCSFKIPIQALSFSILMRIDLDSVLKTFTIDDLTFAKNLNYKFIDLTADITDKRKIIAFYQ